MARVAPAVSAAVTTPRIAVASASGQRRMGGRVVVEVDRTVGADRSTRGWQRGRLVSGHAGTSAFLACVQLMKRLFRSIGYRVS